MLQVTEAKYLKEYQIEVLFNDKRKGTVDLKEIIICENPKNFYQLKDLSVFKNFKVDYTIVWNEDLILHPNFFILKLLKKIQVYSLSLRNGAISKKPLKFLKEKVLDKP